MNNLNATSNDHLRKALDIAVIDDDSATLPSVEVESQDKHTDADTDFENVHEKLTSLAEISMLMTEELAKVALVSQSPKAYETLSKMISSAVQASKAILEARKQLIDIKNADEDVDGDTYITNNTLVLTTAELQQHMIAAREQMVITQEPDDNTERYTAREEGKGPSTQDQAA